MSGTSTPAFTRKSRFGTWTNARPQKPEWQGPFPSHCGPGSSWPDASSLTIGSTSPRCNQMNILSFAQWVDGSPLGHAVRDSLWLFPVIEASHLIGLAVIGGCILIVNLR